MNSMKQLTKKLIALCLVLSLSFSSSIFAQAYYDGEEYITPIGIEFVDDEGAYTFYNGFNERMYSLGGARFRVQYDTGNYSSEYELPRLEYHVTSNGQIVASDYKLVLGYGDDEDYVVLHFDVDTKSLYATVYTNTGEKACESLLYTCKYVDVSEMPEITANSSVYINSAYEQFYRFTPDKSEKLRLHNTAWDNEYEEHEENTYSHGLFGICDEKGKRLTRFDWDTIAYNFEKGKQYFINAVSYDASYEDCHISDGVCKMELSFESAPLITDITMMNGKEDYTFYKNLDDDLYVATSAQIRVKYADNTVEETELLEQSTTEGYSNKGCIYPTGEEYTVTLNPDTNEVTVTVDGKTFKMYKRIVLPTSEIPVINYGNSLHIKNRDYFKYSFVRLNVNEGDKFRLYTSYVPGLGRELDANFVLYTDQGTCLNINEDPSFEYKADIEPQEWVRVREHGHSYSELANPDTYDMNASLTMTAHKDTTYIVRIGYIVETDLHLDLIKAGNPAKPTTNTNAGGSNTVTTTTQTTVPTVPAVVVDKKNTYKVAKDGTVSIASTSNKKATTVSIPNTVAVNEKNAKVVCIEKNAFKGMKKLNKVTIGKNVTTIKASAFGNCKKLKTVTIKSTKLKKIAKNAFKGCKKVTFMVPKSKQKAYKKLFKKSKIGCKYVIKAI